MHCAPFLLTMQIIFASVSYRRVVADLRKKNISTVGKVIASVLVLLTSWVGLLVYYFYAKDHLEEWFK